MIRKQKNRKIILIAILLLVAISIGYAGLTTTLSINGTANVASTSWNVYFTNIQTTNGSVTGTNVTTEPTILETNTTSLSYVVTLDKPGDFYEFTVDVVNGGTINAKIADNGITKTTLNESQDILANYTVTYLDGGVITAGDKLSKSGQTINGIGDTRTIKVRVEYDPNITVEQLNSIGDNDVTLTLNLSLNYVQD